MPIRKPSYRYHNARDCAVVTIGGKDHYLGEYDSPESWEKYHRLIAEFLAARSHPSAPPSDEPPLTITELIARYWRFAKSRYVKHGQQTSEVDAIKFALRFLRRLYGGTFANEFSPKKLKAVREAMITHELTRSVKGIDPDTGKTTRNQRVIRTGLARRTINKLIGRIKRLFAWAVEEELVSVGVHAALLRVPGLRTGESAARETGRVRPVSVEDIEVVLLRVRPTIAAMIQVQRFTGARPQEVVLMRAEDIAATGAVWEYRPGRYKTEHHNPDADPDRDRVLFLGPQCQTVLRPLLDATPSGYLFSPGRSERERLGANKTPPRSTTAPPLLAGTEPVSRGIIRKPVRAPLRPHYPVASYRQAIRRACHKAGIPVWVPNQLRHARLTEIRKRFGLEASRVCGGHREVGVTQLYAEQDQSLARDVMKEIG